MAKKNHTLLAMLAGAALAGGYLYMKKMNEQAAPAPEGEGEGAAPEGEDYGWKATFTDADGSETSVEEATAELKEEAAKVLNEFKETAKVAGAELLAGLKKAYEEMKVAVSDAQQAAQERRAQMAEEAEEPCCEDKESCCCEAVDEALEEVKEAADDVKEEVEDKVEDIKEEVEDKVEEAKEAFEEVKDAVEEKIEEIKE